MFAPLFPSSGSFVGPQQANTELLVAYNITPAASRDQNTKHIELETLSKFKNSSRPPALIWRNTNFWLDHKQGTIDIIAECFAMSLEFLCQHVDST